MQQAASWKHWQQQQHQRQTPEIANYNIDNIVAPVEVYNQATVSPSKLTDQVAVDVTAAAGNSSTPSGENISMSDDETILENCLPAQ